MTINQDGNPNLLYVASHFGFEGGATIHFTDDKGVRGECFIAPTALPHIIELLAQCLGPPLPAVDCPRAAELNQHYGLAEEMH